MKGNPENGIRQSETLFDYEEFVPPEPVQENENEGPENSSNAEMSAELDALMDLSIDSSIESSSFNDTLMRSTRYENYRPFQSSSQITNIETLCSDPLKKLYENNGLSCTDLRIISIIS